MAEACGHYRLQVPRYFTLGFSVVIHAILLGIFMSDLVNKAPSIRSDQVYPSVSLSLKSRMMEPSHTLEKPIDKPEEQKPAPVVNDIPEMPLLKPKQKPIEIMPSEVDIAKVVAPSQEVKPEAALTEELIAALDYSEPYQEQDAQIEQADMFDDAERPDHQKNNQNPHQALYTPPRSEIASYSNPKPFYPRAARTRGMEGQVLLRVKVDTEGLPLDIIIEKSSGFNILDRSATKAVQNWRFQAATLAGIAVVGEVLVPINFELQS